MYLIRDEYPEYTNVCVCIYIYTYQSDSKMGKEDTQLAKKHKKRYSISLVVRGMQIKSTRRYHFTPIRMDSIFQKKTQKITSVGEDVEKLEPLCIIAGDNVKLVKPLW